MKGKGGRRKEEGEPGKRRGQEEKVKEGEGQGEGEGSWNGAADWLRPALHKIREWKAEHEHYLT